MNRSTRISARPSRTVLAVTGALLFAWALVGWSVHYRAHFTGLESPDAMDYAQIGRSLSRGEGMVTHQSFPYVLGWLEKHHRSLEPPWPNLIRFPLPVWMRALSFSLLGESDFAATFPGAVYHAGTAVLLFLLGTRIAHPLVGAAASLFYVSNWFVLDFAISGLSETGAAFYVCLIALLLSMTGDPQHKTGRAAIALGVCLGIAYLQRFNLALLSPILGVLVWIGPEGRGSRIMLRVGAGCVAIVVPFLVFKTLMLGSPTVFLSNDRTILNAIVGDPFYGLQQYDIASMAAENPGAFFRALNFGWWQEHWNEIFGWKTGWILPLLVAAGLLPGAGRIRSPWLFTMAGVGTLYLFMSWGYPGLMRYYFPFAALGYLFASIGFFRLLTINQHLPDWITPWLASAMIAVGIVSPLWRFATEPRVEMGTHPLIEEVALRVPAQGLVFSDISSWVTWYTDRDSIRFLFPIPDLLETFDANFLRVDAIALHHPQRIALFERRMRNREIMAEFEELPASADGGRLWLRVPDHE